jgi:hypothetical protein
MIPRREVSRIEGFSDAVFGFALTLLVVSLEVPDSIDSLKATLGGFVPFAATFSVVCWIWFEHYAFFRRFGLEDGLTVLLNNILLFVVLFFVYPLKFVFGRMYAAMTGAEGFDQLSAGDGKLLMVAYSAGFVSVFAVFALFHWNAWRRRDQLELDVRQALAARRGIRTHLLSVSVGVVSLFITFALSPHWLWLAGVIFCLLGPLHGVNGYLIGRERERLEAAS